MSDVALATFHNKRILLLQGPLGPFFSRLRKDLECISGARVYKVNLNGGDWLFYPKDSIQFHGTIDEWPTFLYELIQTLRIDVIILFGDCRAYHRIAIEIATEHDVEIKVFEEGYFRPDYITFESHGVNGFSLLPMEARYYRIFGSAEREAVQPVGNTFWHLAMWAIAYYLASTLLRPWFRNYRHHRPLEISEGVYWVRAFWRKLKCRLYERKIQFDLLRKESGTRKKKFFLVPLQTHCDHQISVHSDFPSVEAFIRHVLASFSEHAQKDVSIVIKHHPMDRGYRDYSRLIRDLCMEYALEERVLYVHDLHLPSLLKHAIGVVVINSTTGLSALFHGTPVKVCGRAIYDLKGLTFQEDLDCFWGAAQTFKFDRALYRTFRDYVIKHTQVNGSFYKKIIGSKYASGIFWNKKMIRDRLAGSVTSRMRNELVDSEFR